MSELNFTASGPASGVPIVFLHGFGGLGSSWDAVIAALGDRQPAVTVDLPGHGGSLHAEGRGGAGRMAKAIAAGLEGRGLARFHLCGHSMGGAVAALIALRAPERVASLTLIAPGGMAPEINAELLGRYAQAENEAEIRALWTEMAAPGFDWPADQIAAQAAARRAPGAMAALGETYASMFPAGPDQGQGVIPQAQLAALDMPVAVIWGGDDHVVPCPGPAGLPASFALSLLPGHGHMLPEEAAGAIVRVLRHQTGG
ncbi:pyruvate dehydrogenase E2 component (dihydrolipoamide acetyltransferase) [Hoeflea marina]|uniref:Pyruvate dehydrogenase E2 component (Dihydrolipoamide acetyltransferase) n=1 Tax=Hoeflea marina TaxID=274592 RepID=A0A317PDE0_9HYPH|nr:alpha/beta fold hydrolase [Hoeflea marina]PWV97559.1 pyruvate dehydrogenase E2 component (dihydrolipoamide acetyltransferase) [Hoeflea marina]